MDIRYREPIIYLVCGKAKHGKDTFSAFLKEVYLNNNKDVIVTQFAKYIKYYAREMTGWDLSEETKPRDLLQQLGTDIIRQKLNKNDLFIDRMKEDIEIFSYFYDTIIISDVRFEHEVRSIKDSFKNVVVVHIDRPNFDNGLTEEQKSHATETGLDNFDEYDYKLTNITFDGLIKDANDIFNERK